MQHVKLAIGKGVPIVPGDTASAERGVESLNLLDPHGFSVGEDGWIPKVAQVKSGALYADNALSDGRQLLAAAMGNVIETIKLTAVGATWDARYWLESRLQQFAQAARDFHTTFHQIEPVYLVWHAPGAPGEQYALVYNIDIAPSGDPWTNVNELTITVEREPAWRPIAPGENPAKWTRYANGQAFNTSNCALLDGTDHAVYATIQNRREWNATRTAELSRNYVDIPASKIPGDAPALVYLALEAPDDIYSPEWWVSRWSKRTSFPERSGGTQSVYNMLNAGDALPGTGLSLEADTGGVAMGGTETPRRARIAFNTDNSYNSHRVSWRTGQIADIDLNSLRGRYAAFLRCRQVNGVFGGITMYLTVSGIAQTNYLQLPIVSPDVRESDGNTIGWGLTYMGEMTVPSQGRAVAGGDGRGLEVDYRAGLRIDLYARCIGGTEILYLTDLILVSLDEGTVQFGGASGSRQVLDNSGYSQHGSLDPFAGSFYFGVTNVWEYWNALPWTGQPITLAPRQDNRLFFLGRFPGGGPGTPPYSQVTSSYIVRGHLVPRWYGVRDV